MEWFSLALRCIVAFVFVSYGFSKLIASKQSFERAIVAYDIAPSWAIRPLAYTLPVLEIFLGSLLLMRTSSFIASIALLTLLALFQGAVSKALMTGLEIGCGCNGKQDTSRSGLWLTFVRNWVVILILIGTDFLPSIHSQASHIELLVGTVTLIAAVLVPAVSSLYNRSSLANTTPTATTSRSISTSRRGFLVKSAAFTIASIFAVSFFPLNTALAHGIHLGPKPPGYIRCDQVDCDGSNITQCCYNYLYMYQYCYDWFDGSYCFPEWVTIGECADSGCGSCG